MKKKLAALAFAGASLAMFAGAPSAGAAHCVSPDGTSPGFSYFGNDHVRESKGDNARLQGDGTNGASSCRDGSDPSTRAPGQNR